jgi:hypothetical protein
MHGRVPNHPQHPMRGREVMRAITVFALLALMGCMKPDPTGPTQSDITSGVEDQNLLAGATSSTNWPTEDGGHVPMEISGKADSILLLVFHDTHTTNEAIAGKVTFYQGGVIPALDPVISKSIDFPKTDSLRITSEAFRGLPSSSNDTIFFTVAIESDSLRSLITGFAYSIKQRAFIKSPFSVDSTSYPKLVPPRYSFRGVVDSSLLKTGTSIPGIEQWCFYIPGSPYFWKVGFDSILEIGPLPYGKYPFRMMRIRNSEGKLDRNRLEVFEVIVSAGLITGPGQHPPFYFKVGGKVLSVEVPASLSIRSNPP